MKKTKLGVWLIGVALFMATLTSCGAGEKQEMKLVNEQTFAPAEVTSIQLDYDNDDITLLESDTGDIILKEYMDIDKSSYYARIKNKNGQLAISEGRRPSGNRLGCHVELYLPSGYKADVALHTTESTIKTQVSQPMTALRAETTRGTMELTDIQAQTLSASSANGTINLSNVRADTIIVKATNAAVNADNVHGAIQYTTSNGKLKLTDAHGSGTFEASSDGTLELAFAKITGDINVSAKNSDIHFAAPKAAAFHFSASSRNGSIDANYDGVVVNDDQAAGEVGKNPQFTVELEARNGDIEAE